MDKTYWLMMPPFFILGVILIVVLPENKIHYVFLEIILFWVAYYLVKHIQKKKNDSDNSEIKQ